MGHKETKWDVLDVLITGAPLSAGWVYVKLVAWPYSM
jgi:hypothetical protein